MCSAGLCCGFPWGRRGKQISGRSSEKISQLPPKKERWPLPELAHYWYVHLLSYHTILLLLWREVPCLPLNFITGILTRDLGLHISECVVGLWNSPSCVSYYSLWQNGDQVHCFGKKSDIHTPRPPSEWFLSSFLSSVLLASRGSKYSIPVVCFQLGKKDPEKSFPEAIIPVSLSNEISSPCQAISALLNSISYEPTGSTLPGELMFFIKKKSTKKKRITRKVDVTRDRDSMFTRAMYFWQVKRIGMICIAPWELAMAWLATGKHLQQHEVFQEIE